MAWPFYSVIDGGYVWRDEWYVVGALQGMDAV